MGNRSPTIQNEWGYLMYIFEIVGNGTTTRIIESNIKFFIADLEPGEYTIHQFDLYTGEVLKVYEYSLKTVEI